MYVGKYYSLHIKVQINRRTHYLWHRQQLYCPLSPHRRP